MFFSKIFPTKIPWNVFRRSILRHVSVFLETIFEKFSRKKIVFNYFLRQDFSRKFYVKRKFYVFRKFLKWVPISVPQIRRKASKSIKHGTLLSGFVQGLWEISFCLAILSETRPRGVWRFYRRFDGFTVESTVKPSIFVKNRSEICMLNFNQFWSILVSKWYRIWRPIGWMT